MTSQKQIVIAIAVALFGCVLASSAHAVQVKRKLLVIIPPPTLKPVVVSH